MKKKQQLKNKPHKLKGSNFDKLKGSHCATQKHAKYIKYSCTQLQNFHFNHTLQTLGDGPNSHFSIQLGSNEKLYKFL